MRYAGREGTGEINSAGGISSGFTRPAAPPPPIFPCPSHALSAKLPLTTLDPVVRPLRRRSQLTL